MVIKPKEKDQPPERMFPSTDIVHHFHPIAWVTQMMLMREGLDIKAGIDWLTTLAVTKEDLDKNPNYFKVPYKNDVATATRTAITEKGEEALDCSELVCRYLQKIGWSKKVEWLNTKGLYNYADKLPKHLERHESLDYKPKMEIYSCGKKSLEWDILAWS